MSSPDVTLVIAAIDARSTIRRCLDGFLAEAGPSAKVVLVDASRDGTADEAARLFPQVSILRRRPGLLAPELWREGLETVETEYVAFTTAQMVPRPGWLSSLAARTGVAGVGGAIAPADGLKTTDRALYLLRYASYCPPVPRSVRFDPPGDNALYRVAGLRAVGEAWADGFWEVEVHRALRARGEGLEAAPDAVVEFQGGSSFRQAAGQRFAHACRYGAGRARGWTRRRRLAQTVATPLVPALLMLRIVRSLRRRNQPMAAWLGAMPKLLALLIVWAIGEAVGAWPARSARVTLHRDGFAASAAEPGLR